MPFCLLYRNHLHLLYYMNYETGTEELGDDEKYRNGTTAVDESKVYHSSSNIIETTVKETNKEDRRRKEEKMNDYKDDHLVIEYFTKNIYC